MRWIRGQCVEEDRSELRQRVEQKKKQGQREEEERERKRKVTSAAPGF